jgi:glycosyltransferase involved in cell wall biosynthesis
MQDPIIASVYIITRNEEQNLKVLLPRLACFDEVVIVDCGSTDGTVEYSRTFPNVVMSFRKWTGFSDQKAFALSLCSNEWVLNLDADEVPTDELVSAMRSLMESGEGDALQCRRILLRNGRTPKGFRHYDSVIRFFRKRCGHYEPAKVHESISIEGTIRETSAELLHYEKLSYGQRIAKSNQYSDLKANDKMAKGKRVGVFTLVFIFPVSFIQCYFGKGCFLDGIPGFLTSMNHAFYNFMKYAKLWELKDQETGTAPESAAAGTRPAKNDKLVGIRSEN